MKPETLELQREAEVEVERLKSEGWTKPDFARALKKILKKRNNTMSNIYTVSVWESGSEPEEKKVSLPEALRICRSWNGFALTLIFRHDSRYPQYRNKKFVPCDSFEIKRGYNDRHLPTRKFLP